MRLTLHPYTLQFKYPFKIAHGLRTSTDVVYVKLEHEGKTAWGEATLPPYLPETQQTVIAFLESFAQGLTNSVDDWFAKLATDNSSNMAAKAALDMALWDLKAQLAGKTIAELLGISSTQFPLCTYTIGVSSLEEMKQKYDYAIQNGFQLFKLKLDGANDEASIRNFKQISSNDFAVDVNQGWQTVEEANKKIAWLANEGCLLVEQPLKKEAITEMRSVKPTASLPIYADESCQRLSEIERLAEGFHGINIKLMKCGGITEAVQMIKKARQLNLKVLIGCMSESSVGCTAASHLSPLADYADLDGPYLIANDPFEGMKVEAGRISSKPLHIIKSI